MSTCVEVADVAALLTHVRRKLDHYGVQIDADHLHIEPYGRDERIGWDTHLVTLDGYGVLGYTDGAAASATNGEGDPKL